MSNKYLTLRTIMMAPSHKKKLRIVINLSIIRDGGGLQVSHSLINELIINSSHECLLLISPNIQMLIKKETFPKNLTLEVISPSPSNVLSGKKSRRKLRELEREFKPDVVFTLFGPSYWKPTKPHLCGFALAQHLYKESPYFSMISFKERIALFIRERVKLYSFKNHCDYWVTETNDVAKRLADKLGVSQKKVFAVNNVYNGIYDEPSKWKTPDADLSVMAKGFKLITISSFHVHKNLTIIPKVIDYLCEHRPDFEFTFILSVHENKFSDLSIRQKSHMLFLGPVELDQCPLLYEQSDALFMPTLLECFTVSYLEAMKMKKPILTSDLPFARNICRDAAVFFDSMSPESIGETILMLATDENLRTLLSKKGQDRLKDFGTATDRARSYLEILEKIAEDKTT